MSPLQLRFRLRELRERAGLSQEALAEKATPWLAGEQPSALDAYALTFLRWGGFAGIDPTTLPAFDALARYLMAQPTR